MSLTNSLEDLELSLQNFFEGRGNYPKFKAKNIKDSYKNDMIKNVYKGNTYTKVNI